MGKLHVVNCLKPGETISVREGSGSTFLPGKSIPPGRQHSFYVHSKATFREFQVVLEKSPESFKEKFNSDECLEWAEIRITKCEGSKLTYVTVPKSSHAVARMMTNISNTWQLLLQKIGKGKSDAPAPQDAGSAGNSGASAVAPQLAVASQTIQATHPEEATQTDGAEDRASALIRSEILSAP